MQLKLKSQEELEQFAATLAANLSAPMLVFMRGDLGAGKTTFVRAFLQSLGVSGRIKSPTYTIVEPYTVGESDYFHFDLYRLGSPLELDGLGLSDYLHNNSLCLIEWPEKGEGVLPAADIEISLEIPHLNDLAGQPNSDETRLCSIVANNDAAVSSLAAIGL